jgi:hypothetical protein
MTPTETLNMLTWQLDTRKAAYTPSKQIHTAQSTGDTRREECAWRSTMFLMMGIRSRGERRETRGDVLKGSKSWAGEGLIFLVPHGALILNACDQVT